MTRTSLSHLSSAEICRQAGWTVGSTLECSYHRRNERGSMPSLHRMRIVITAVGERIVVGRIIWNDGTPLDGAAEELIFDLHAHDWEQVG